MYNHCFLLVEDLELPVNNVSNKLVLIFQLIMILTELLNHESFAFLVHIIPILEEFLKNINFVGVLSDFEVLVKQNEVRAVNARGQLKLFPDFLIRQLSEIRDSQIEVNRVVLVELLYVRNFVILSKFF
jgi:hypothetical protein